MTGQPDERVFIVFGWEGNHLIHPIYSYGGLSENSTSDAWFLGCALRSKCDFDDLGTVRFAETEDGFPALPHVSMTFRSNAFQHGGGTFWCIKGPDFESAAGKAGTL